MKTPEVVKPCVVYINEQPLTTTNVVVSLMGLHEGQEVPESRRTEMLRHFMVDIWLGIYLGVSARGFKPERS